MRIAVVGNGPSAQNMADKIDACDFVVRVGWFMHMGAKNTGLKLNAWVWFGNRPIWGNPGERAPGTCDIWSPFPKEYLSKSPYYFCAKNLDRIQDRKVAWVDPDQWAALKTFLRGCEPTSGMTAVMMAADKRPDEIHLFGFDATTSDRPGWGDDCQGQPGVARWPEDQPHDHLAEKRMLKRFAERGEWRGLASKIKLVWHNMPAVPEEVASALPVS